MVPVASDDFLFLNEDETEQNETYEGFWDLLIVDDDPEVHSVTQLALSGLSFWHRQLRFHHAYSGEQAVSMIAENADIAVVLLDVVMETDDAGLVAVKRIREELDNHHLRIILRTGQPGYAPEENIIREYDINDYKTKTELTRSKLVTSIVTAIRSYQQLRNLSQHSQGLESILTASKAILGVKNKAEFAQKVVQQLCRFIGVDCEGVMCASIDQQIHVLGGTEHYQVFSQQRVEQLDNSRAIGVLKQCNDQGVHQLSEYDSCFIFSDDKCTLLIYLDVHCANDEAHLKLVEVFLTTVSIAFDNLQLFTNLRDAAYLDRLTGLPNRNDFVSRICQFYAPNENRYLLYLIDIAEFSSINNGLGQDVGNLLLKAVVQRIQEDVPKYQLLARIGADVFALVVDKAVLEPKQLNGILSYPYRAGEHQLPLNFHIGICEQQYFRPQGLDTLKAIYIALNQGKNHGHLNYEYYDPEMEEKMVWQLGVLKQLRQDFADNKLQVWYQPQIDFSSTKVIGCEALLRWPNDDGFISPAVFVPLAEQSGLILEIGRWVLEQACQLQKRLAQNGYDIRIAVNVSVPQFRDPNFVDEVKSILESYHVEPKNIELEVTESIVMDDPAVVINALQSLKEYGIEIAIDDFGTGFSSLSYLQKLPLNRIKIDRAFVKDIPDTDTGAIAELIVALGKKLQLKTIAEGIETREQANALMIMGCNEAQGFMYSKPLAEQELIKFLSVKK